MTIDEEELLEELRSSQPQNEAVSAEAHGNTAARHAKKRRIPPALKILVVFSVLGGALVFLLLGTEAGDAFVYSKMVGEVMVEPQRFVGRELRVEGQLESGSIEFQNDPCEHRFVLVEGEHRLPVRFPRCVVPDTFRDDMNISVVVEGQLQTDHSFTASQVIPRCPSKYDMEERQENGEEMPDFLRPRSFWL